MLATKNHINVIGSVLLSHPYTCQDNECLGRKIKTISKNNNSFDYVYVSHILNYWYASNFIIFSNKYKDNLDFRFYEYLDESVNNIINGDMFVGISAPKEAYDGWRELPEQHDFFVKGYKAIQFLLYQCDDDLSVVPIKYKKMIEMSIDEMTHAKKILLDYIISTLPSYKKVPWGF